MGASRKWLKTIVSKKLSPQGKNSDNEQSPPKKPSKWNLLKSCGVIDKGSTLGGEEDDDIENGGDVSGDNAKASRMVLGQAEREEWAAICIQTAFRGFLDGWCDTMGTVEEIQARAQQRQEAAIKRERAMAYAFSNQWRANSRLNLESLFDYELDNSTWSWIWLDRWINNQPSNSNPLSKPDAQAIEDTTGKNFALKKSASHKSPNSKLSLDTPKGNHSNLARARSHGAGTGLHLSVGNKPNGKKQAQKLNAEQSSKQRDWRSFSNPKQRPSKEVKRKYSLPSPVRKLQTRQAAAHDKATNGVTAAEEEKKDDIVHSQAK